VISWNGIASYGAIAIGAPLGVAAGGCRVLVLGPALLVLALARCWRCASARTWWWCAASACPSGRRSAVWRLRPGLTLASIGYGTLTTFVTLYYLERGWTALRCA
jgi:hypothetical protein